MYPTPSPSPVRRSSRSNKGVTSKYDDYETGKEFDASCMHSMRGHPYQRPVSAISAQYPTVNLSGYDVPCPAYHDYQPNQIYGVQANHYEQHNLASVNMISTNEQALQQMYSGPAVPYNYPNIAPLRVFSPEQNKVFVFDGNMWNEFNLEKVFS